MAGGFSTEDMLDTYLFENQQLLEQLQTIVLEQKDQDGFDDVAIHDIFRTMHTIKASSSVMMFDSITVVSHKLEDVFAILRDNHPKQVSHLKLVEHVLEVADFIAEELEHIQKGESLKGDTSDIIERLDVFLNDIKDENGVMMKTEESKKDISVQRFYIAPVMNTTSNKVFAEEDVEDFEEESFGLDIFIDLESSVEEIEARVERTQSQIMAEAKTKTLVPGDFVIEAKETRKARRVAPESKRFEKASYMNVEIAKMDRLMDIVERLEAVQTVAFDCVDVENDAVSQLKAVSAELKQVVVSMRKTSLIQIFQKMNRVVFDVSRKLGKDIEFVMQGEETEIDRNIVEHISDSLMHLVRNAVDHGIETPEEKVMAGKMERSRIILSAKAELDKIYITVEDNGKGLNRDKIIQKARKKGLIDEHLPESAYSDEEVFQFITLPGFSTKDSISEYSGRGVGMDVVVSNIASIGGRLDIESEEGKGSKMILTIPITSTNAEGIVI